MEKRVSVCAEAWYQRGGDALVSVALINHAPAAKTVGEKVYIMKKQTVKRWKYVFRVNGAPYGAIASSVEEAIIEVMKIYHKTLDGEIDTIKRDAEREKYEPYNEHEHVFTRLIPDDE